ncbi:MAG: carboxylating nicotinate-nucleotide diphosphorylase [Nitriliruptorales bacterium]
MIPPRSAPPHVPIRLAPELLARDCRRAVARALAEDLGSDGDITSHACVPAGMQGAANVIARGRGVIAGLTAVNETFAQVDDRVVVVTEVSDGDEVEAGAVVARVQGPLRSILTAERTVLNLLGHLSGIATVTRAFVDLVRDTGCIVRDTRKTLPGLRLLEKAAVIAGGGMSHRIGLHDAVLVKDSHIVATGGVGAATRSALARAGDRPVQVEVTTPQEVDEAIAAGARDLLIDNVSPEEFGQVVAVVAGRAGIEASGGITLANVRSYAEAGADRVAVGALTHSAPWLDVALELDGTSLRSAFSGLATQETGTEFNADEEEIETILVPDLQPREHDLAPVAPEPDPAGPVTLVEDIREVPLSDLEDLDEEDVYDEEEPERTGEEADGPNQTAG